MTVNLDPPGDLPEHLADLPADARGYRAPAEAPWNGSASEFSRIDSRLTLILGARRACPVCGYEIAPGETMYRIWSDPDVATVRSQAIAAPYIVDDRSTLGHLSCMLYSALVCPHWKTAGAHLGKDSMFGSGVTRGARPALFGFKESLLTFFPDDPVGVKDKENDPKMFHAGLVEEIAFEKPAELHPRYLAACAAEDGLYRGRRRFHSHPGVPHSDGMDKAFAEVRAQLNQPGIEKREFRYGTQVGIQARLMVATPLGRDIDAQLPNVPEDTVQVPDPARGNRAARRAAAKRKSR